MGYCSCIYPSFVYVSLKEIGVVDLDMYTWGIKDFHKCWSGSLAKRRFCLGPASVINCTPISALSFWVSLFPGEHGYNSSTEIPSPLLTFFIVMLPKAYLASHSRMSGSRWVIWVVKIFFVQFFCVFLHRRTRQGADCGSDHEHLTAKFRLKLKKVGKTTRSFRYDLNQIPYDYTVEVTDLRD